MPNLKTAFLRNGYDNGKKSSIIDDKVAKLMETVQNKRRSIATLTKPSWLTNCSLVLPGFERINIQIEKNLSLLAIAIGTLSRMKDDTTVVMKDLQIDIPIKWQNYLIDDWITDLSLRIKATQIKEEQTKLKNLEIKLQPLLSEDQRREMALAEIEKQL